jgi:hypothetical protein
MEPSIIGHTLTLPEKMENCPYAERIEYMYQQQFETWNMARNHYRQFESVEKRPVFFDGFRIDLQHNPARARSTCADLSKKVIETRKCFLCSHHLPAEQKGFILLNKYLMLVNPFPIVERHLTISDFQHIPQRIEHRIEDILGIAEKLNGYTVFYNGPKCGASAPDHFHFQAVKKGILPIDQEIETILQQKGKVLFATDEIQIVQTGSYLRTAIVFQSSSTILINQYFEQLYRQLPSDEETGEPMMNLLANHENGRYRLTVFPRKAQRPSCYYREGAERILVSPASVELSGIVVTPREEDFQRITKEDLEEIFGEVTLETKGLKFI